VHIGRLLVVSGNENEAVGKIGTATESDHANEIDKSSPCHVLAASYNEWTEMYKSKEQNTQPTAHNNMNTQKECLQYHKNID